MERAHSKTDVSISTISSCILVYYCEQTYFCDILNSNKAGLAGKMCRDNLDLEPGKINIFNDHHSNQICNLTRGRRKKNFVWMVILIEITLQYQLTSNHTDFTSSNYSSMTGTISERNGSSCPEREIQNTELSIFSCWKNEKTLNKQTKQILHGWNISMASGRWANSKNSKQQKLEQLEQQNQVLRNYIPKCKTNISGFIHV